MQHIGYNFPKQHILDLLVLHFKRYSMGQIKTVRRPDIIITKSNHDI